MIDDFFEQIPDFLFFCFHFYFSVETQQTEEIDGNDENRFCDEENEDEEEEEDDGMFYFHFF